ncbi:hypothetical protein A0J61_10951 [Choanephora cucurbitarum]|uniref:Retrotransposon gag domain-containing protein n=1 Tax=Choanephora cucurbitarum TaxID=101091 RepID=A0A1C7MVY5_9FUNG|nr:hypothetical protein A0J61_10951 [Choanephora cucurbitarum]
MDNSNNSVPEQPLHPSVIEFMTQLSRVFQTQADISVNNTARPPTIQLQRPEPYDGSRNVWKIDGWIRSIERLQDYYGWDDTHTFRFARTLLSGRAEAWFSS